MYYILIFSVCIFVSIQGCRENPEKYFGYGYSLSNKTDDLHIVGPKCNIGEGPVINCKSNVQFITMKEKPRMKIYDKYGLWKKSNREPEREKLFNAIKYYDYWIIDMPVDSVYGPYQKAEFEKKFDELNLPDSLRVDK